MAVKKRHLSLRIEDDLHNALAARAAAEDRSTSYIVIRAIRREVKMCKWRWVRGKTYATGCGCTWAQGMEQVVRCPFCGAEVTID